MFDSYFSLLQQCLCCNFDLQATVISCSSLFEFGCCYQFSHCSLTAAQYIDAHCKKTTSNGELELGCDTIAALCRPVMWISQSCDVSRYNGCLVFHCWWNSLFCHCNISITEIFFTNLLPTSGLNVFCFSVRYNNCIPSANMNFAMSANSHNGCFVYFADDEIHSLPLKFTKMLWFLTSQQ